MQEPHPLCPNRTTQEACISHIWNSRPPPASFSKCQDINPLWHVFIRMCMCVSVYARAHTNVFSISQKKTKHQIGDTKIENSLPGPSQEKSGDPSLGRCLVPVVYGASCSQ